MHHTHCGNTFDTNLTVSNLFGSASSSSAAMRQQQGSLHIAVNGEHRVIELHNYRMSLCISISVREFVEVAMISSSPTCKVYAYGLIYYWLGLIILSLWIFGTNVGLRYLVNLLVCRWVKHFSRVRSMANLGRRRR